MPLKHIRAVIDWAGLFMEMATQIAIIRIPKQPDISLIVLPVISPPDLKKKGEINVARPEIIKNTSETVNPYSFITLTPFWTYALDAYNDAL